MSCASCWLLVTLLGVSLPSSTGYLLWCSPKLWEGLSWTLRITHTDQGPDVIENTAEFSVDIIGQRYARKETGQRNGQHYSVFYLYYYAANTLYKVQDGICESSDLRGNVSQHCVEMPGEYLQARLEYLKEYLGDYQSGVWSNGVRAVKDKVEYFYSEDPEGFIPLNEEKHGEVNNAPAAHMGGTRIEKPDSVPTYTVTTYNNATLGIKDPSIFTPPDNCTKSQVNLAEFPPV